MIDPEASSRPARPAQVEHNDLQLIRSEVSWFTLNAVHAEKNFHAAQQPIMCDFDIVRSEKPERFYTTLLVEMPNSRKSSSCLSFSLSMVTEFEFRQQAVPTPLIENEVARWEIFQSALAIAYGTARAHLINYLAPTVYRGYLLPMVNLKTLFDQKYQERPMPPVPSTRPSERPKAKETQEKGKGLRDETIRPSDDLT